MTTASIAKLPALTWQFGAIAHCCWRFLGTIGNSEITPFLIHAFIPSNWRDSLFEDERDRSVITLKTACRRDRLLDVGILEPSPF
ncbi:MAG: hypothetical protein KME18_21675 [Phormidium tanganyikae FI6-MK23]|nr:hypothetical protein [Phormidium tanganyikae FI6-MK23]